MARAKTKSDELYNARRRFRREAQRYLAKAEKSKGLTKARYEAQARSATISALQTYKGKEPKGQIKQLVEQLDITESTIIIRSGLAGASQKGISGKQIASLITKSYSALRGRKSQAKTRDEMARDILSTGNIGSRFYGGLVNIWGKTPESRKHPNQAILEYFNAESLLDVIEEIESAGINLYAPDVNDDVYISAQLKLQEYISTHKRIK